MTTINPHPTMKYDQPEDYHFSHDSIFLARKVFDLVQQRQLKIDSVLDLCSGCGIIGLDFLFHLKKENLPLPQCLDFLEVQQIYKNYFETNVARLNVAAPTHFIHANYNDLTALNPLKEKYDLIISNPPYFRRGHGTLSKSEFKNRCRFFIDADFTDLIRSTEFMLARTGVAFVLIKSLSRHGIDALKEMQQMTTTLNFKKIGQIRATDLYEINKS